ncbi:Uncharacterized membrane protein YkvA, DUF1232 family [Bacillus sp. OV322]|uniref:YkvA family protein n=1 Tax=Bacillus sp. OV322 TaxID=1882764 RepID=UPI0008E129AA|nr:YkvA family protein [Bacillus sp. OV322]SFC02728.1 Uncharacterized membrane protein YkvA, DUF1232 family [Bacillus sp. OV322]
MLRKWLFRKVAYTLFSKQAKRYAGNKGSAKGLLANAERKAASNQLSFKNLWAKLQTMLSLLKAWSNGSYRKVPYRSLIMILISVIYFVSPIDIIPDFLIGFGLIDDAAVVAFVLSQIDKDLVLFEQWQREKQLAITVK